MHVTVCYGRYVHFVHPRMSDPLYRVSIKRKGNTVFQTKVRIEQIHPSRAYGATSRVLSGWIRLSEAQTLMGTWSYFVPATDMLVIRDRFGRQQGLGLMGKVHDLWD